MIDSPIRLAFIGAGIFARQAHLPAVLALGDTFKIVAVCSQRRESAEDFNTLLPEPADICKDLDSLLARDDIEAVDIMLPIDIMPRVVEKALAAGKHVISEKPAAPDVAIGRKLLAHYAAHPDQVWMVAENWRYEPVFLKAAEIVRGGELGRPLVFDWALYIDMTPGNRYYHTEWRRASGFPGGFLLDGGVHQMAVLRMIFGEVESVSAMTTQFRADLPPADTLSAVMLFKNGVVGSFTLTYAAGAPWQTGLRILGQGGAITVQRDRIEVAGGPRPLTFPDGSGVQAELAAFAAAIRQGAPHVNTPAQGVQDVAVIEAMLRAADTGTRVKVEKVV